MYVMVIANGYPTAKYKGLGIFEFDQAKALAKAGCKVAFVGIDVRSIKRWRKWGIERHEIEGVHVYVINIPLGKVPKALLHKVMTFGLNIIYKRILKEFGKPDVLHAHFTDIGYVASKLKQQIDVPLVITEHSSLINKTIIEEQLFDTAAYAYRQAEAVISVSPALGNVIEKHFKIRPMYVPNIVDTDIFSYAGKKTSNKFSFVSTGNLVFGKRMDLTVEAFYRAFHDLPNATLTIFGEGPERPKIEEIIRQHGLKDRVVLMGMCSRSAIAEKLRDSHCFVLASQSETFGVSYIEALAAGVPVIATKCGGPEGFVHGENGLLIPVDDVDELCNAMLFMYNNSTSFDGEKIAIEAKTKFSAKRIAERLLEVYDSL